LPCNLAFTKKYFTTKSKLTVWITLEKMSYQLTAKLD